MHLQASLPQAHLGSGMRRYNSYRYGGEKWVVLSTAGSLGGHSPFLGTAFLVVGGTSVVMSLIFLALHSAFPRPAGDAMRLSWNQNPVAS